MVNYHNDDNDNHQGERKTKLIYSDQIYSSFNFPVGFYQSNNKNWL